MKTASENVVRAAARTMAAARAGDVLALAIISVGESGEPEVTFAGEAELLPSINIGLDIAKQTVVAAVCGRREDQATTSILRPAQGTG